MSHKRLKFRVSVPTGLESLNDYVKTPPKIVNPKFTSSTELVVDFDTSLCDLRYLHGMNFDNNESQMSMDIHHSNSDNMGSCRRNTISHVYIRICN